ncbi:aldo/keto reductase [Granulicella mallensis]|uniref:Aryl-alcohol dehydrogenase-like predicted oxidoreductase n=1 Tax=Granulicella mallensis TaxID=940614 RepID=A0A7W7ZP29_9BACT|nr:aldo/keto reductase [Granulicella mallensis]MBB5063102.1 aryl-alcohol dehydrogenase-like predicted oxidoreductase [Granulicella mallensis]
MRLPAISTQRKLGSTGLEAAGLGFGCFGLSNAYGPADPAEAVATLHRALDLGCSLLDTADIYGAGQNELLVGQALRGRRDHAVVATKFGFVCDDTGRVVRRDASPAYVRQTVEGSLKRLGIERIDLYTLHRVDPNIPIEDTVGAMAELVVEGKIRGVGLSEVSVEQLRRAHAIHPIATVQSEYSLWCREPEREILPACRELGVSFVAFAPLGRGFFSGALATNELPQQDFRRSLPRFQAESLARNEKFLQSLAESASRKQITLSQLALSWILAKGNSIFAIPGTRRQRHLEENVAAMQVEWTFEELEEIDRISAMHQDPGARYAPGSLFAPE